MFEFRHLHGNIWGLHALSPPSAARYALAITLIQLWAAAKLVGLHFVIFLVVLSPDEIHISSGDMRETITPQLD